MTGDKIKKIKTYVEGTHGFLVEDDDEEEVTLVMCKDCKWRNTRACFCKSPLDVKGYWFCSEGEKKTECNVTFAYKEDGSIERITEDDVNEG